MIVVDGEPVGKGRPRMNSRTGTIYTPTKTHRYEEAVHMAARRSQERVGDRPVIAVVTAVFAPPVSWSKRRRLSAMSGGVQKDTKPDLDNVIKSALDGLQPVCFTDDKQIVACVAMKSYAETPRLEIELYAVESSAGVVKAVGEAKEFAGKSLRDVVAKIVRGDDGAGLGNS